MSKNHENHDSREIREIIAGVPISWGNGLIACVLNLARPKGQKDASGESVPHAGWACKEPAAAVIP